MSSGSTHNAVSHQIDGGRFETAREFFVTVELYLSPKAATGVRKPHPSRRKTDKRDSMKQASSLVDDSQKKLREKASWLSIGRGSPSAGQWRTATCKLTEEDEGCLFNIYIDEAILHQSVYVYLLNHTDIRVIDQSLLDRKDCIGIYCVTGQRWSATGVNEPIFLSFSNSDTFHTWIALLRSYARPEVYGQRVNAVEGGLYRMWRQIEINCIQGRNLGATRQFVDGVATETPQDTDGADHDNFCEIYMNDILCARTTAKKSLGYLDWHEAFLLPDLPPFGNLEIIVFREKRTARKVTVIGSVSIALGNFRRGEYVEGWFPVLDNTAANVCIQVGEIRLKLKVDEEIILPYYEYSSFLQTLNSHNYLDWMDELGTKLQLKDVSAQFISIAVANKTLIQYICALADREVDGSPTTHNTLFRGNTTLTKTIELFMAWYGKAFLEASVGDVIRRICTEKVSIEVDPARSGKNSKDIEKNVDLLLYWSTELWNLIYAARNECPQEMRNLFEHIRKLVEKRYRVRELSPDQPSDLPWQSVSAFCFLRFIVPAVLHPHLFGLVAGLPDLAVQRSLTLIAKVIQNLANLNLNVQKEEFMRAIKEFLANSRAAMIDYIFVVSSPGPETRRSHSMLAFDERFDRLQLIDSINHRSSTMPLLHREAIPALPYLLDVPKHLAVISSAVIRRLKEYHGTPKSDSSEVLGLVEFCEKCYVIEEHALRRVNRLASRIMQETSRKRPSTMGVDGTSSTTWPKSDLPPLRPHLTPSGKEKGNSVTSLTFSTNRPSTAPSPRDGPSERGPTPPILHAEEITSSPVDATGAQFSRKSPDTSLYIEPSSDVSNLRRVQTYESMRLLPSEEATHKRKGFFRAFLSRK